MTVCYQLNKLLFDIYSTFAFYSTEFTTLNSEEKELFHKFCTVLVKEFLPYLNKCVQTLFSSKSMAVDKSASSVISLDIDQLSKPLLPMMPHDVMETAVDTKYDHNVDTVLISKSDSGDHLAGTDENTEIASENKESTTQEEQHRTNDNLPPEHSEIPLEIPS